MLNNLVLPFPYLVRDSFIASVTVFLKKFLSLLGHSHSMTIEFKASDSNFEKVTSFLVAGFCKAVVAESTTEITFGA